MTVVDGQTVVRPPEPTPEALATSLDRLLADRWSCRAFRAEPVADDVLTSLFAAAQRTASWCNTQPWHTHLVTGAARDALAERLYASASGGGFSADLQMPTDYRGVYLDRRRDAGYRLYEALGIAREDREARARQMLENYRFFGAPHVAILTSDRNQGVYAHIDVGAYVANVMHAATARGVASCPQAAIAMQSDVVREFLGLAEDRVVVCAVALGYADEQHPANSPRIPRAAVEDALTVVTEVPAS